MNRFIGSRFIFFIIFIFGLLTSVFTSSVNAKDINISCPNRFLTLINPVRGRNLWSDQSLLPLKQQYENINNHSFSATWLLQYDTFFDADLTNEIKFFNSKQEKGVFLEVSKKLATDANVIYPSGVRWSDPGAVFLSAYSQNDRIRLIDQIFNKFKELYGYYPKSVGAWWIDSYSLHYMVNKYGIKSTLICADQKVTDSYGIWGQWWGFPYKPSKANILVPASNMSNMEEVVVLQWAQRDPTLAYGGVGEYSKYSLQANDYVSVRRDINYFKKLSSQYLSCQNDLGQITVGLETGMESLMEPVEYQRQLLHLSTLKNLNSVTMADFANFYSKKYGINPDKLVFGDSGSDWEMNKQFRKNTKLGDFIKYDQNISFKDYFIKDNSSFLDRVMSTQDIKDNSFTSSLLGMFMLLLFVLSIKHKKIFIYIISLIFYLASFGLIYRSGNEFGWLVFYGPIFNNVLLLQISLLIIIYALVWIVSVKFKSKIINLSLFLTLLPLSFGLDTLIRIIRFSMIDGKYFLGVLIDRSRVIGMAFSGIKFDFLNMDLPIYTVQSFLKLPLDKILLNPILYLTMYPLIHILIACLLYALLIKIKLKLRKIVLITLTILLAAHILWIFGVEPVAVIPTFN